MIDEFQRGYDKALKDLTERLKVKGINIDEVLTEVKQERKQIAKPTIYFTKLNKKGELEYDRDKTMYYANHPDELETYFASQQVPKQNAPKKKLQFTLLKPDDNRYKKVLADILGHKTEEMCAAENKLLYGDVDMTSFDGKSQMYLNALGNQLMFLTQSPFGYKAVCAAAGVDDTQDDAIQQVLDRCVPDEALFIGK